MLRMIAQTRLAVVVIGFVALAEDVLHSSRLMKRGLLPDSNYNFCIASILPPFSRLVQVFMTWPFTSKTN